jgi:hypothetical protein
MTRADRNLTDKEKMLFGAGFVFGVMYNMVLLAMVLSVASPPETVTGALSEPLLMTALSGVVFAAIVGSALSYLAFPENRTKISVDADQFETPSLLKRVTSESEDDGESETDA